ncbi:hypothetical protein V1477_017069 [Vespula maculifrons]|uniref:Uncharacterized protein n=1 Tax=Vespula maculifrons TaxID=7453 RepID=A0ABD2B509_VESMC
MDTLVETAERRLSHTARIPIGRSRVKGEMVLVLVPRDFLDKKGYNIRTSTISYFGTTPKKEKQSPNHLKLDGT